MAAIALASAPVPVTGAERALLERAWAVLVDTARERRTISYSELALAVGMPHRQRSIHRIVVGPLCRLVCRPRGYPDIASLVVRKDTGEPGDGWWDFAGGAHVRQVWLEEVRAAQNFPWPEQLPL